MQELFLWWIFIRVITHLSYNTLPCKSISYLCDDKEIIALTAGNIANTYIDTFLCHKSENVEVMKKFTNRIVIILYFFSCYEIVNHNYQTNELGPIYWKILSPLCNGKWNISINLNKLNYETLATILSHISNIVDVAFSICSFNHLWKKIIL